MNIESTVILELYYLELYIIHTTKLSIPRQKLFNFLNYNIKDY